MSSIQFLINPLKCSMALAYYPMPNMSHISLVTGQYIPIYQQNTTDRRVSKNTNIQRDIDSQIDADADTDTETSPHPHPTPTAGPVSRATRRRRRRRHRAREPSLVAAVRPWWHVAAWTQQRLCLRQCTVACESVAFLS